MLECGALLPLLVSQSHFCVKIIEPRDVSSARRLASHLSRSARPPRVRVTLRPRDTRLHVHHLVPHVVAEAVPAVLAAVAALAQPAPVTLLLLLLLLLLGDPLHRPLVQARPREHGGLPGQLLGPGLVRPPGGGGRAGVDWGHRAAQQPRHDICKYRGNLEILLRKFSFIFLKIFKYWPK